MDGDVWPIEVPGNEATWREIEALALSFDGYQYARDKSDSDLPLESLAALSKRARNAWIESGKLPFEIDELRAALFFNQRALRHVQQIPKDRELEYIKALVATIGHLSGGTVSGSLQAWNRQREVRLSRSESATDPTDLANP